MSAAIRIADSGDSLASAALTRPQVQSRRVSLQIGPLGLTYSADDLLWGSSSAASASTSIQGVADSGNSAGSAFAGAQTEATRTVSDASWTAAETEDFPQEFAAARRVEQAFARAATAAAETRTYRPSARSRAAAAANDSSANDASETNAAGSASAAATSTRTGATSAMRRAIAAYLSCGAQDATAGLLDAVA